MSNLKRYSDMLKDFNRANQDRYATMDELDKLRGFYLWQLANSKSKKGITQLHVNLIKVNKEILELWLTDDETQNIRTRLEFKRRKGIETYA
jgi:hypothetical protein